MTLADMTCPILAFVGETDEIAPARSVRAARWAAPRSDVYEVTLPAGHFGLVVGSTAVETTWPTVAAWAHWRAGDGELPERHRRIEEDAERAERRAQRPGPARRRAPSSRSGPGSGPCRRSPGAAIGAGRTLREVVGDTASQLDQLNRLGRVNPRTRISFGLLLDEQAEAAPDDVVLLFEDRAHTQDAVKQRVDNVVRGLLEIGVRQGEHVGVLMQTRPSALTVVAALNRLGAVAVLMRPDGDPAREAELGRVRRIIADPQNAEAARPRRRASQVYVLGGGGKDRKLAPRADRHGADRPRRGRGRPPGTSRTPAAPATSRSSSSPAAASGRCANRITNRRWALSAFGTASSASLSRGDTVYSASPVYHPSALLMSVGGRDRRRRPPRRRLAASSRRRSGTRCAATAPPSSPTPGR